MKKCVNLRKKIKLDADKLKSIKKFTILQTYEAGESFGELSLLYGVPRALSIAATRNCVFMTIHKDDFNHFLKRFEKKKKDQIVDFFKNVTFLQGLSNQSIVKMEYSFKLHHFTKAG